MEQYGTSCYENIFFLNYWLLVNHDELGAADFWNLKLECEDLQWRVVGIGLSKYT